MEIGKIIARYRKQKGLTQVQLGELAHTDHHHICRIENAARIPPMSMIQSIAAALGLPAWVLLYEKDSSIALEILALLEDCTENEQSELCANLAAMKSHMRAFR